jgi:hypothetical protein
VLLGLVGPPVLLAPFPLGLVGPPVLLAPLLLGLVGPPVLLAPFPLGLVGPPVLLAPLLLGLVGPPVLIAPLLLGLVGPPVLLAPFPRCVGHDEGMTTWKPHSLARPHEGQLDLSQGDRVQAKVDLPGVVEGTPGKVMLANGFNWMRYRVRFSNGVELPDLDERHLTPVGRAARRLARRAKRA